MVAEKREGTERFRKENSLSSIRRVIEGHALDIGYRYSIPNAQQDRDRLIQDITSY